METCLMARSSIKEERESVCVRESERERESVCVRESERESERERPPK